MPTSQRARLAVFLDIHASQNGTGAPTILLSDAEALDLLGDVQPSELSHPDAAEAGAALLAALGPAPSAEDEDALAEWANRKREASARLWDALSGQVIDGVQIARKPPKAPARPAQSTESTPEA